MNNSLYVYISSDNSRHYYINEPYDYTVYLPETLKFRQKQQWVVGVAEIQYTLEGDVKNNMIEIYSDICGTSIIHEKKKPILRNITILNPFLRSVVLHKNFSPTIYVPLIKNELRQIRLFINTHDGKPATCVTGITKCTLHFKVARM